MIEIRADARRAKERPVTRCDGTRRYCAAPGKWNGVFISGVTQRVAEMPPAQSLIGGTAAADRALISPWNFADAPPKFPGNLNVTRERNGTPISRSSRYTRGRHTICSRGGESPGKFEARLACRTMCGPGVNELDRFLRSWERKRDCATGNSFGGIAINHVPL